MTQNNLTIMDAFSDDSFMPPPTKRQKYLSMNCHSFNTPLSFSGEFNRTSTPDFCIFALNRTECYFCDFLQVNFDF